MTCVGQVTNHHTVVSGEDHSFVSHHDIEPQSIPYRHQLCCHYSPLNNQSLSNPASTDPQADNTVVLSSHHSFQTYSFFIIIRSHHVVHHTPHPNHGRRPRQHHKPPRRPISLPFSHNTNQPRNPHLRRPHPQRPRPIPSPESARAPRTRTERHRLCQRD